MDGTYESDHRYFWPLVPVDKTTSLKLNPDIVMVLLETRAEINEACGDRFNSEDRGCYYGNSVLCKIYVLAGDAEIMEHEEDHCSYGPDHIEAL